MVGFQKSRASSALELRFTVNLVVVKKTAWDELRREHSYVKDTPPPGVEQREWDRERLAQSYFTEKPSATDGSRIRLGRQTPTYTTKPGLHTMER